MAGPKKSPLLSTKKPKARAAKPATATKPSLSTEFVVDSDDSGDAKTARVKNPTLETAKSSSNTAKSATLKPSISQAKSSKKGKSLSPSSAKDDSSGSESETDSGSQDEKRFSEKRTLAAQDRSPTPKPKTTTARPVLAKPSIKPSINVKPLNQKEKPGSGTGKNGPKSEATRSSEDGSSGSESGSGSESESGSSDQTSPRSLTKKGFVRKSVSQQPIPIYEPPAGFESSSISLHPASKLSEILAPSNLQEKQIWHITVPTSVPISLAKEVSGQSIGNGASVLEHHGAKYGLVPESEAEQTSSRTLLLPSAQTNDYRPSKTNIIKTLHLQQLVSLPSHALEPAVDPNRLVSASESYRKTPRQQPEGLRMRYRPFGVSDDSDLESSSKPMPKALEFRVPAPLKEASPARKRKRHDHDGSSNTASAVKSKKQKQSSQATAGANEDAMDINGIPDKRSNGGESLTKSPHLIVNGIKTNGNLPNGNETKEGRKRKGRDKPSREQPMPTTALPLDVKQYTETMQPGEIVENVPIMANAVEGASTATDIPPRKESKDEKAKRREEKRRRKEMQRAGRGASLASADDVSQREVADSQHQMIQKIETAQREASIHLETPKDNSLPKPSPTAHGSPDSTLDSSQISQRHKMKEERAKRRDEKKKRKMESGSA